MPFEIVRNDITDMQVDAIVNTANPRPVIGAGTDSRIHERAGSGLLTARQQVGAIGTGCAAITPAFDLHAKYVIHTVGPVWNGGSNGEEALLRNCYENSLNLALEYGCKSIGFPLISTGHYGFPKDKALQIAIAAFSAFLLEHEMTIFLVVFDHTAFRLSEKLFQGVTSYIDENYVDACKTVNYGIVDNNPRYGAHRRDSVLNESCEMLREMPSCPPMTASKATSLENMLKQQDAGFTETLLRLIDQTGQKDSAIYKKAGLTKQHFSKIRNDLEYKPTKSTAIALAIALELDLEATHDLIGRAGYTLSNSSKFDLIIRYFIEQRKFNIVEINTALYEFDQALLGSL